MRAFAQSHELFGEPGYLVSEPDEVPRAHPEFGRRGRILYLFASIARERAQPVDQQPRDCICLIDPRGKRRWATEQLKFPPQHPAQRSAIACNIGQKHQGIAQLEG
jgi:hypothetical protein